jgi:hypothetical protein
MTGKRKGTDGRDMCSQLLEDGNYCPNKASARDLCAKHAGYHDKGICTYDLGNGTYCPNKASARDLCAKHAGYCDKGICTYDHGNDTYCPNKAKVRGLCATHAGYRDKGTCFYELENGTTCHNKARARGLCDAHAGYQDKGTCSHPLGNGTFCPQKAKNRGLCSTHAGYQRCEADCCKYLDGSSWAEHKHPVSGIRICTFAARVLVAQALYHDGDVMKYKHWMKFFGFKRDLVLRAEHAFYFMLVQEVPELSRMVRALDQSVAYALEGKAKRFTDPRPDYLHYNPAVNMALYGEFDENDNHEDNDARLGMITDQVGCGLERTYVFRVRAHINDPSRALFVRKVHHKHHTYYSATDRGKQVVQTVAQHVRECLALMSLDVPPTAQNKKVLFG